MMQVLQRMLAALAKMGHQVQADVREDVAASWVAGTSLMEAGSTLAACMRTELGNRADILTAAADRATELMPLSSRKHD